RLAALSARIRARSALRARKLALVAALRARFPGRPARAARAEDGRKTRALARRARAVRGEVLLRSRSPARGCGAPQHPFAQLSRQRLRSRSAVPARQELRAHARRARRTSRLGRAARALSAGRSRAQG